MSREEAHRLRALARAERNSERLSELAQSGYPGVQRAVIKNPRTPPAVVEKLARNYPAEFFENPSLPLFLQDPSFLLGMEPTLLCGLLLYKTPTPFWLLLRALKSTEESVQELAKSRLRLLEASQEKSAESSRTGRSRSTLGRRSKKPYFEATDSLDEAFDEEEGAAEALLLQAHLAPWTRYPLGRPFYAVATPYHKAFIAALKSKFPEWGCRSWCRELKIWMVDASRIADLASLLLEHFPKERRCEECFRGRPCSVWTKKDREARENKLGGLRVLPKTRRPRF